MIATGSLSAFSSAALPQLPSQVARGAGGVQPARATQVQPQLPQGQQLSLEPAKPAAPPAGRVPPRGSLLDLSV